MGWFGVSVGAMDEEEWRAEVRRLLTSTPSPCWSGSTRTSLSSLRVAGRLIGQGGDAPDS
jgi:hypothetical protein